MSPTSSSEDAPRVAAVLAAHAEVQRAARRLEVLHDARSHCGRGCSGCCVDGITVFSVEADVIRARHGDLLASGVPHPEGACAFLNGEGACRIYPDRPYVCRTQGLPLRWTEDEAGQTFERRDICPLNEAGEPLEDLPAESCWTLGPVEEHLARIELTKGKDAARTSLRDLFQRPPD